MCKIYEYETRVELGFCVFVSESVGSVGLDILVSHQKKYFVKTLEVLVIVDCNIYMDIQ